MKKSKCQIRDSQFEDYNIYNILLIKSKTMTFFSIPIIIEELQIFV